MKTKRVIEEVKQQKQISSYKINSSST